LYDVDAIRAAHPIAETVRDAGVALRRNGRRLTGRCPFHDDRDPSFVVYPETASYFCYGCGAGGDVIDFVGRLRGTDFRETAALLADGVSPRPVNVVPFRAPRTGAARAPADDEAAVIDAAAEHYARSLQKREALDYLRRRGIDRAIARELRVGYADGGLAHHLRARGLDVGIARDLGLLSGDRDAFAGRIVVPDLDGAGSARWLTGRAVGAREPRYLNLRAPSPLLGFTRARSLGASAVVLTEGPFDWLTACTWRLHAVALLGTHVSNDTLVALMSFRRIYLALDAGEAGHRARARLVSALGPRATVVPLRKGVHDLNELGRLRDGREAFLGSLYQARARKGESWRETGVRARHARAA
jgi:DNA primase